MCKLRYLHWLLDSATAKYINVQSIGAVDGAIHSANVAWLLRHYKHLKLVINRVSKQLGRGQRNRAYRSYQ